MVDILCTVANFEYMKYAERLIESARDTGFEGRAEIIPAYNLRYLPATRYSDDRWMQFELDSHFKFNDRILYLDADCVIHKSFPWGTIFDHEFACSVMPDWADEMKIINGISGYNFKEKFVGTPFAFRKTKGTNRFFQLCRALIFASAHYGRGTMVPFNVACHFINQPSHIFPGDKTLYPVDIDNGVPENGKWLTHFAGGRGKEIWEEMYGV